MDPGPVRMDPELGKFKAGSGINHSGSATQPISGIQPNIIINLQKMWKIL